MRNKLKFRLAGILIMLAMCIVFGAAIMLLWNAIIPQIFGLAPLSYLQAVGLLALTRMLFGGFGGGWHGFHGHHHRHELREKWMNRENRENRNEQQCH